MVAKAPLLTCSRGGKVDALGQAVGNGRQHRGGERGHCCPHAGANNIKCDALLSPGARRGLEERRCCADRRPRCQPSPALCGFPRGAEHQLGVQPLPRGPIASRPLGQGLAPAALAGLPCR